MVHFQLTKNCNLRCWFCGQWGKKGFFSDDKGEPMELSDWKRIAEELVDYRGRTGISPFIMLWGGEPLYSPYFDELAEYLKKKGFRLGMVTNGTMIAAHKDVIERCISNLYVSIDGPRDIHDGIRGEGVFDTVTRNLKALSGCKIIVMSVVTSKLIPRLSEFLDSLDSLGISELYLQDMIGLTSEETEAYAEWMKSVFGITAAEIRSWENNELDIFDTEALIADMDTEKYSFKISCKRHNREQTGHCMSPFRHAHIAWNGNVLYCTDFYDFSAGNVKENTLESIFFNEISEKYRSEIIAGRCVTCKNCSWKERQDYING
ncbi:MAG: radical SAM protein [Clostridiales bacterium]|nr:radical SAM protein [Clostridiales bacterium]